MKPIDPERWRRIEAALDEALELPLDARAAFLRDACEDDLRGEVEALLAADADSSGPLDPNDEGLSPSLLDALDPEAFAPAVAGAEGQRIGPYRLVQRLGEGGMGVVWQAEQQEPVRRTVALKLIKWGMDTEQVVARFEAERQALALMDHPNVARVYDAGATPEGRPYFVMEYVQGAPIHQHCDRERLTTRERLELFLQVCSGVQHAHQKGLIHRDLKPSNVLVSVEDERSFPKIIDFGIAKATSQKLTERTLCTELGQLVGTPEYMSPEQADLNVQDVDIRSDVYAMGIVLYQLLVGALPFDLGRLRSASFDEIRRIIREEEPSKPSTRLESMGEASTDSARLRRTDLKRLVSELRGDLDWIVIRALEKDRTRRYQSISDLAADLQRHLRHEPVLASPPSVSYRTGKFVKRHWGVVSATAAVLTVLILGAVVSAVFAVRESRSRREAERQGAEAQRQAKIAEAVNDFLITMLGAADPRQRQRLGPIAREIKVVDVLDASARTIEGRFEEPLVEAAVRSTMGESYMNLGENGSAEPQLEAALRIRRARLGADHPDTLTSMDKLGNLRRLQGREQDAETLMMEALATRRRVLGDDHHETLTSINNLGLLRRNQERLDEAEQLLTEAFGGRRGLLGDDHPDTLVSMNNLGITYYAQGKFEKAEQLHRQELEICRRVLGEDHPDTLISMGNLADAYREQSRYAEAAELFEQTLAMKKRVLGEDHPDTLNTEANLALTYVAQRRLPEAEARLLRLLDSQRRVLGVQHPRTLTTMVNLGVCYLQQGRLTEAAPMLAEALAIRKDVQGPEHPDTMQTMSTLAELYRKQNRHQEAEGLFVEVLRLQKRALGDDHMSTIVTSINLVGLYNGLGRYNEAESLAVSAHERATRVLGESHFVTLLATGRLATLYRKQGRPEAAEPLYHQMIASARRTIPENPEFGMMLKDVGTFLVELKRYEDAENPLLEAQKILKTRLGPDDARTRGAVQSLIQLYEAWGKTEQATAWREGR